MKTSDAGDAFTRPQASDFRARLEALYQALKAGFSMSDAGLVPVFWEGFLIGRTRPEFAEKIGKLDGALLSQDGLILPSGDLTNFGFAMRDKGLSQGWRGEKLDLVPLDQPEAAPVGTLERALYRPLGAQTSAVHLAGRIRNPRDERDPVFLLGKRSAKKLVGPGLWDGLAAGMIQAGEAPLEALARESQEEAGLTAFDPVKAEFLACDHISRPVRGGWMHEVSYAYAALLPEGFMPEPVDGEVDHFECVSAEEALNRIEGNLMMKEAAMTLLLSIRKLL